MFAVAWALYSTEELAQLMEEPCGTPRKPETLPLEQVTQHALHMHMRMHYAHALHMHMRMHLTCTTRALGAAHALPLGGSLPLCTARAAAGVRVSGDAVEAAGHHPATAAAARHGPGLGG